MPNKILKLSSIRHCKNLDFEGGAEGGQGGRGEGEEKERQLQLRDRNSVPNSS